MQCSQAMNEKAIVFLVLILSAGLLLARLFARYRAASPLPPHSQDGLEQAAPAQAPSPASPSASVPTWGGLAKAWYPIDWRAGESSVEANEVLAELDCFIAEREPSACIDPKEWQVIRGFLASHPAAGGQSMWDRLSPRLAGR